MESNVNLQSLDPRKQELLEARFLGSRFQPLNASSNPQDNSNLSAGSNAGDDEAHLVLTPEKPKTPSERKRKRKATASDSTESTTPKSTRPEANGKKINDYFKQNQSPSRSSMNTHLGTKSPSPQGIPYGYTVPSPGSLSNSDSMGYPLSGRCISTTKRYRRTSSTSTPGNTKTIASKTYYGKTRSFGGKLTRSSHS